MKPSLLELAERIYPVLRDFPADGQLQRMDDQALYTDIILSGLVQREEVQKPCKCCGTPKFDYAYFRITPAGRLFMTAMSLRASNTNKEQE
jgi:hypothetical protein